MMFLPVDMTLTPALSLKRERECAIPSPSQGEG